MAIATFVALHKDWASVLMEEDLQVLQSFPTLSCAIFGPHITMSLPILMAAQATEYQLMLSGNGCC